VLLALTLLPVGDVSAYIQAMSTTIGQALGVDYADVLLLDVSGREFVLLGAGSIGRPDAGERGPRRVAVDDQSALARAFQGGAPYCTASLGADPEMPPALASAGMRALLAVPLVVAGARRGLLYVASHAADAFGPEDEALLAVVAARVSLLLENAELAERRAELEREQARQQARQEFLGVVSHELKTPVAVIKAYGEALLHRANRDGDAEGARILERIDEQAGRMLALIDDLLDLQRLETGLMTLERSAFDLADLAVRVVELLQATTTMHHLRAESAGALAVWADRRRVEEVLTNLIENAIKYSPAGGDIVVATRTVEDATQALIAVSDQGMGIAPADLPRVFDRFYQGDGGRLHRGIRGLGVGLYLARELVERQGGTVWADSVQGVGTTVYVTLPLAPTAG